MITSIKLSARFYLNFHMGAFDDLTKVSIGWLLDEDEKEDKTDDTHD